MGAMLVGEGAHQPASPPARPAACPPGTSLHVAHMCRKRAVPLRWRLCIGCPLPHLSYTSVQSILHQGANTGGTAQQEGRLSAPNSPTVVHLSRSGSMLYY